MMTKSISLNSTIEKNLTSSLGNLNEDIILTIEDINKMIRINNIDVNTMFTLGERLNQMIIQKEITENFLFIDYSKAFNLTEEILDIKLFNKIMKDNGSSFISEDIINVKFLLDFMNDMRNQISKIDLYRSTDKENIDNYSLVSNYLQNLNEIQDFFNLIDNYQLDYMYHIFKFYLESFLSILSQKGVISPFIYIS
jgi:hypothetical protein